MKSHEMRTIILKPLGNGKYQWMDLHFEVAGSGDIGQLVKDLSYSLRVVLVVPAQAVVLKRVDFDEAERKLLSQTVPYNLEPDLSEDVERLHFALGQPVGNSVDVALLNREQLRHWLRPLQESDVECVAVVPEQLNIPWEPGTWTIVEQQKNCLVRYAECSGFAIHRSQLQLALQLLMEDSETGSNPVPNRLRIFAAPEGQHGLRNLIPDALLQNSDWCNPVSPKSSCDSDYWIQQSEWREQYPLNLLQGEFLPPLPWRKWWLQSRAVAALAVLALCLHLVYGFVQNYSLREEVVALQTQVEQTYRELIPRGKLVDPEKQLQRKVNALKGETGSRFIPMYRGVAEVLWNAGAIRMQAMSFSSKQSEIRMTLVAPSFNDIETLRANIERQHVTAELSGVSNEQGKTRARLVIRG